MFQHFVCGEFLHFAFTALFDYYPAGCVKIKLKAWNIFSSVEVDVDMLATCSEDTNIKEVNYLPFCALLFFFLPALHISPFHVFVPVFTTFRKRNTLDWPGLKFHCQSWQNLAIV